MLFLLVIHSHKGTYELYQRNDRLITIHTVRTVDRRDLSLFPSLCKELCVEGCWCSESAPIAILYLNASMTMH